MVNIITCPQCANQLGIPHAAATTAVVECPKCQASFSLCETDAVALPEARMLFAEEEQAATASVPDSLADSPSPPIVSKDCRSHARAAASAAGAATSEDRESEVDRTAAALADSAASFGFELDLDLPESEADQEGPLNLTLPDSFLDATPDYSRKPDSPQISALPGTTPTRIKRLGIVAAIASAIHAWSVRHPARIEPVEWSGLSKIVALAAAPVVGTVLGLYGLLWLPGPKTESMGRAHALSESELPAKSRDTDNEPLLAKTNQESLEIQTSDSSSVRASTAKSPAKSHDPVVVARDEAVMTVSVVPPVAPATSIVPVTASEFSRLVEDASAAVPTILTGDLSVPASVRRKGHAYMALCRLAEQFDLADQRGLAPAGRAKVRQAERIFQRIAADPDARRDLVHIASRWWEYRQRPNSGIVLLGRVHETRPAGAGMLCWVQVGDQSPSEAIPVLLMDSRYEVGDLICVVGSVVSSRSELPADLPADLSAGQVVRASCDYHLRSGI